RKLLAALGALDLARRLYVRVVPDARRNQIDNDHQRLLLAFCLAADANCIDVGAHNGVVLREMVRCAPRGSHIAFEPLPEPAARLRRDFPGVDVRQVALSDRAGETPFVFVRSNPEMSGLREREYPGQERLEHMTVRAERLDDALPTGYVPALIKIDVEGAELLVLRGATNTLRTYAPVVVFEHGVGAADRYGTDSSRAVFRLRADVGLRSSGNDGRGTYTQAA